MQGYLSERYDTATHGISTSYWAAQMRAEWHKSVPRECRDFAVLDLQT